MYSVLSYGDMARDGVRMDAYARAIASVVRPGSVVLDIGAGTGILSILAAKAGARSVHAVDPNPAILLLPDLAQENGVAERIHVHHGSSLELELGERVDVVVSDLRGSFPLHGSHIEILRDAQQRLLAPGGTLLPVRDRFFVGVVETPEIARRLERVTEGFARRGLAAAAARNSVFNTAHGDTAIAPIAASDVLSTGEQWSTVDYATFPGGMLEGEATLTTRRGGIAHALAIWFEATIHGDLGFSNAPGFTTSYARPILPLLEPVALEPDDRVHVVLRVDEHGSQWTWDTTVETAAGSRKARFRQATFLGMPASAEALLRGSSTFKPARSNRADRVAAILAAMDGSTDIAGIAEHLLRTMPGLRREAVLEEIRDVVTRLAR